MFRAVTDVLKYVVGVQQDFRESSVDSVQTDDQQTDKTKSCTSPQQNVRSITGSVTQMCSSYGLIDSSVYFAVDAVVGGVQVREGDNVRVTASRQHSDAGWRADRVELIAEEKWRRNPHSSRRKEELKQEGDGSRDSLLRQSIVGTVTKLSRYGGGVINGDAAVFSQDVVVKGYVSCLGDWVKADIQCVSDTDDEQQWTATRVQPLRVRTFEGRVRALFGAYGFIDEDIYFSSKVCGSHYQPKAGDMVRVTAIECSYKQSNWRALRVEPSGGRVVNHR